MYHQQGLGISFFTLCSMIRIRQVILSHPHTERSPQSKLEFSAKLNNGDHSMDDEALKLLGLSTIFADNK